MKTSTMITALFAITAQAGVISDNVATIHARQEVNLAGNQRVLDSARQDSASQINGGSGRGRILRDEKECSDACSRCRAAATISAVAEVLGCGTAAVAVDALTAGAAVFLSACGFIACEAAVVATLNEKEATCTNE